MTLKSGFKRLANNWRQNIMYPGIILCVLATTLVVVGATAGARIWITNRRALPAKKSTKVIVKAAAEPNGAKPELGVLPIQLYKFGFVPRDVTAPAGNYLLVVGNQSGTSDIGLSLKKEHGTEVRSQRIKRERLRWREKIHLTPGVYVLTEENNPEWVCRILITSK